jgi:predicted TIM-barrel fold metal-dependent hydrolase
VAESAAAREPGNIVAIDCHAHVMRRDFPLAPDRHSAPARDVTVDEFIGVLDANEISHGVLTAPSFYGADNTLLLMALDAHPRRLRGTVIVDPEIDPSHLVAMDRRGAVGIRLNWVRRDTLPDAGSDAYQRLFASVRALDWHIEIYLEGPKLATVLPHLRASGANVVVDHFASPDPKLGVADPGFREALAGVRAGDTWVKLSAPYRLGGVDPQRYVDALLDAGGPAQLVWASDWPFVSHENDITYRQCVDWLRGWVPDDTVRTAILTDTPARLFHFDRDPRSAQRVIHDITHDKRRRQSS